MSENHTRDKSDYLLLDGDCQNQENGYIDLINSISLQSADNFGNMEKIVCSNKKKYKKRRQCNAIEPITSYGLILFCFPENPGESSSSEEDIEGPLFLIYQRRDNFEYMDFLRGVWVSEGQLPALFSLMSHEERERIRNYTFHELWNDLWVIQDCRIYKDGVTKAEKKYDSIKNQIPYLLDTTTSCIYHPPWGFPKGKKNGYHEDPLKCAIREF